MTKPLHRTPSTLIKNAIFISFVTFMLLIGYIDYLTSDYSMVLFYILYVAGLSWYLNASFGIVGAVMATIVAAMSDYFDHHDSVFQPMYYWNWFSSLAIFIMICVAVTLIKKHNNPK